jgi:hypothetical protein
MKSKLFSLVFCAALAGFSTSASAVNLVANGGFETGDFASWTHFGGVDSQDGVCNNACPHSGTFGASFGTLFSDSGITQDIVTVPGAHYTVSFWFRNRTLGEGISNDFLISFGGATLTSGTNVSPFLYTLFSFDAVANSTSSTLSFSFRNEPSFFNLDDVTVEAAATPLPAAFPLFAAGGTLLGFLAWRRKRKLTGL